MSGDGKSPIGCVGVICFRGDEVLLIRRGTPPRQGEWSIPGGRIEPGESEKQAALRELLEETGVTAKLCEKITIVDAQFEGRIYRLHDYRADWLSGEPRAGDDAADARFIPLDAVNRFQMWSKTQAVILKAYQNTR